MNFLRLKDCDNYQFIASVHILSSFCLLCDNGVGLENIHLCQPSTLLSFASRGHWCLVPSMMSWLLLAAFKSPQADLLVQVTPSRVPCPQNSSSRVPTTGIFQMASLAPPGKASEQVLQACTSHNHFLPTPLWAPSTTPGAALSTPENGFLGRRPATCQPPMNITWHSQGKPQQSPENFSTIQWARRLWTSALGCRLSSCIPPCGLYFKLPVALVTTAYICYSCIPEPFIFYSQSPITSILIRVNDSLY